MRHKDIRDAVKDILRRCVGYPLVQSQEFAADIRSVIRWSRDGPHISCHVLQRETSSIFNIFVKKSFTSFSLRQSNLYINIYI